MNNTISTTFKKLLGKGRAFLTPKGFTEEFYNLFASSFDELKERITELKYSHFPTKNLNLNDIKNGEELFGLDASLSQSELERAENVEAQWSIFNGTQNYKQIENIIKRKGIDVQVIENIPLGAFPLYFSRTIGNGQLETNNGTVDPVQINLGENTFILMAQTALTEEQYENLVNTIVKNKPAQNAVYFLPRGLRKKEIHNVLRKREMEEIRKKTFYGIE